MLRKWNSGRAEPRRERVWRTRGRYEEWSENSFTRKYLMTWGRGM